MYMCVCFRLSGPGTPLSDEWPPSALRAKHHVWWNSTFCGWPPQQTGPAAAKKGAKESRGEERQNGRHVREPIQIENITGNILTCFWHLLRHCLLFLFPLLTLCMLKSCWRYHQSDFSLAGLKDSQQKEVMLFLQQCQMYMKNTLPHPSHQSNAPLAAYPLHPE